MGFYNEVTGKTGFWELDYQIEKCKSHSEPHHLSIILKKLMIRGIRIQDVDFLYLHSSFSPCNQCNHIMELFSKTL